jgi:hypothetical protein
MIPTTQKATMFFGFVIAHSVAFIFFVAVIRGVFAGTSQDQDDEKNIAGKTFGSAENFEASEKAPSWTQGQQYVQNY